MPRYDDGCEFAPSCLECPFSYSCLDKRGGLGRVRKEQRNKQIINLSRRLSQGEIARRFGVSERTVQRICGGN